MEDYAIICSKDSHHYVNYDVTNVIELDTDKELISFFNKMNSSKNKPLNISIPIAATITACARVHMTQFKNSEGVNLYYTDTDSIDIDAPLNSKFIGQELGKMKLEHIFEGAVFLAPQVYGGITSQYEYVKVKCLKNTISFSQLKPLLIKDTSLKIHQEKWYRNISEGKITIKDELYTLMVTENKRILIYDESNQFVNTKAITLINGINSNHFVDAE